MRGIDVAKILVLDDVIDAGILIQKILGRRGHEVIAFGDEDEALAHARTQPVDLAILDIKLKRMSGIEVLAELRKINPAIRILMLTGYPTVETARQALDLGAADYCVKPISKDELEDKVAEILAG